MVVFNPADALPNRVIAAHIQNLQRQSVSKSISCCLHQLILLLQIPHGGDDLKPERERQRESEGERGRELNDQMTIWHGRMWRHSESSENVALCQYLHGKSPLYSDSCLTLMPFTNHPTSHIIHESKDQIVYLIESRSPPSNASTCL